MTVRAFNRGLHHRGLTLIELMAVIVVLGLVTGTVAFRIASVQEDVELRSAAEAIRELDRRARLHSQTGARVLMKVATEAPGSSDERDFVVLIDLYDRTVLSRINLPTGAAMSLRADEAGDEVVFDRTGRSGDYSIHLSRGLHSISWSVRGSTGAFVRTEARR